MTLASLWMASPPEVHSSLLTSGPGAAPLIASAAAWRSLGVQYSVIADELELELSALAVDAWQGPSATSYVVAHQPFLAWLRRAAVDYAGVAVQHEAAAAGYVSALSAMPTLAELAANHTAHTVLVSTNFFGINTIPITFNEIDYLRMWIQAAIAMSIYEAITAAALTPVSHPTPAPLIVRTWAGHAGGMAALAAGGGAAVIGGVWDWIVWILEGLLALGELALEGLTHALVFILDGFLVGLVYLLDALVAVAEFVIEVLTIVVQIVAFFALIAWVALGIVAYLYIPPALMIAAISSPIPVSTGVAIPLGASAGQWDGRCSDDDGDDETSLAESLDSPTDLAAERGVPTACRIGAGPIGLAGTDSIAIAPPAAGLMTLDNDELLAGIREPMLPSTWSPDLVGATGTAR